MPLTRTTVTAASRIMLPAYVVLTTAFGVVYVLDPGDRLGKVSALTFQRSLLPMSLWGCVMLALALVMVAAFTRHSRMMFAFALACCAVTWFLWGCLYVVSVATTTDSSLLAPVLPWFVTAACTASMVSLLAGEK